VSQEIGKVYFDEGHLRPAAAMAIATALADKIEQKQMLKPR
jgi:lysophospholipase L1-like esterase